jgi:hypothetical protein
MKIAVVGATGLVGQEIIRVIQERKIEYSSLLPVASENSVGKKIKAGSADIPVISIEKAIKEEQSYLKNNKRKINFLNDANDFLSSISGELYECGENFYKFISLNYAAMHTDTIILSRERLLSDPVCFRYRFRWADDTNLWLRISSQGKIGYYDRVLAYWREHDLNTSSNGFEMAENGIEIHEDN